LADENVIVIEEGEESPKNKKKIYLIIILLLLVLIMLLGLLLVVVKKKKQNSKSFNINQIVKKLEKKKIPKDELKVLIKKANILFKSGKKQEALNLLEKISNYSESLSFYNLGVIQIKEKHYKKALIAIPTSIEAKLGLTKCYLASGKLNSAIATSGSILKVDYYNYYGNYYLASALIEKKSFYSAKTIVGKMLSLYPSSVIFLEQLAKINKALEPKKVATIYENIEILDPNNVMANSN